MSIVVVAIPSDHEVVWEISSEKIPHLTLLYMDDTNVGSHAEIATFVQHAAKMQLESFGLSVSHRGTLGADKADVLFFDSAHDGINIKELRNFRASLLKNDTIFKAYSAAEQFPMWTPHLTLGYPETPAKEDKEKERYGLSWINFDRIAVWFGDFDGPEFKLDSKGLDAIETNAGMWSEEHGVYLAHFGVKGMKWGVRRQLKKIPKGDRAAYLQGKEAGLTANLKDPKKINQFVRTSNRQMRRELRSINSRYTRSAVKYDDTVGPKYRAEVASAVNKVMTQSAAQVFGTSRTGLYDVRTSVTPDGNFAGYLTVKNNPTVQKQLNDIRKSDEKKANKEDSSVQHAEPEEETLAAIVLTLNDGLYELDELEQSDFDDLDDFLAHFGVKGMKWGVRRRVGPDGLVKGSVDSAIADGQKPKSGKEVDRMVRKVATKSGDQQKMEKNLQKKLESLSTAEIKEITQRVKAINDLKKITAEQKEAKKSFGRKMADWALDTAVATGKREVEKIIGEKSAEFIAKAKSKAEGKTGDPKADKEAAEREAKRKANEKKLLDTIAPPMPKGPPTRGSGPPPKPSDPGPRRSFDDDRRTHEENRRAQYDSADGQPYRETFDPRTGQSTFYYQNQYQPPGPRFVPSERVDVPPERQQALTTLAKEIEATRKED